MHNAAIELAAFVELSRRSRVNSVNSGKREREREREEGITGRGKE